MAIRNDSNSAVNEDNLSRHFRTEGNLEITSVLLRPLAAICPIDQRRLMSPFWVALAFKTLNPTDALVFSRIRVDSFTGLAAMFDLLTRILLWLLIGVGLWFLFNNLIPRNYLTWLGGFVLFAAIVLAFQDPNDRIISIIWSILSFPLRPLGLAIVLLMSAANRKGWKGIAAREASIALAVLLIFSTPVIPYWLSNQMEESIIQEAEAAGLSARPNQDTIAVRSIVVLAPRITPSSIDPFPAIRYADLVEEVGNPLRQRLVYAAELYGIFRAAQPTPPLIVVTGNLSDTEVTGVRRFLEQQGVRRNRIRIDPDSSTIRRSAENVRDLIPNQAQGMILIAPSLSLRRAGATFINAYIQDGQSIDLLATPTDLVRFEFEDSGVPIRITDLLPNVQALSLSTYIIDEYLTSIYYFLRGWAQIDYPLYADL